LATPNRGDAVQDAFVYVLDALLQLIVAAFLVRLLMQLTRADFRNPLAGPWVLGITAGARLGVAFILFLNGLWMTGASLGALQGVADASLAAGARLLNLSLLNFLK